MCKEIPDGLALIDPRYLMQHRAGILDLHAKGQLNGAEIDSEKVYVARPKDLQADAHDFAEFAKLVFSFSNLVAEKNPEKRAQRHLALSNDARIQEALARVGRLAQQKLRITPSLRHRKPRRL